MKLLILLLLVGCGERHLAARHQHRVVSYQSARETLKDGYYKCASKWYPVANVEAEQRYYACIKEVQDESTTDQTK